MGMGRRGWGRGVAVFAVLALAVAACGTTVPARVRGQADQQASALGESSGPGGLGASGGLGGPATSAAPADGTDGVGGSGGTGTGATGGSLQADAGGAGTASSLGAEGPPGAGSTVSVAPAAPLQLGVLYIGGLQQLAAAFGSSANSPDPSTYIAALVATINKEGGIGGHQVTVVDAEINTESTTDLSVQYQAACSTFTEDHHVFAVASPASISDDFASCLAQAHVPLVSAWGIADFGESANQQDPLIYEPNAPSAERSANVVVTNMLAEGWAAKRWGADSACAAVTKPRIGVLTETGSAYESVYNTIIAPRFAAAGTPITDVVYMNLGGDVASAIAEAASQSQSAVLKFASDCVDHILMRVPNPIIPELFMTAANDQSYTPRYSWDSDDAAVSAQALLGHPETELNGSLGVGWQPYTDVPLGEFDATAKAPGAPCLAIFAKAGLPASGQSDGYSDLQICDSILFLQTALSDVTGPLSVAVLQQQVTNLGSRYAPSLTYRANFSATQHDGASAYRTFAFNDACTCFQYTSGLRPF